MSLYNNFQDLSKSIKLALDRKANKDEIPAPLPTGQDGDILVNENGVWVARNPHPTRLPDEYQEVEYLESTGVQRIETGYINDEMRDVRYKGKIFFDDSVTRQAIGSRGFFYLGVVNGFFQSGQGLTNSTNIRCVPNRWYDFDISFLARTYNYTNSDLYIRNSEGFGAYESYTLKSGSFELSSDYKISLFSLDNQNLPASCRMGEFELYLDGVMVRQFIPCYRKSDNEIGMYDLVSNQLFINAGTGTFLKGADI